MRKRYSLPRSRDGIQASDHNKVLSKQLASAMKGQTENFDANNSGWSVNSSAHALTAKLEGRVNALEEELEKAQQTEKELLHDREASVGLFSRR